MANETHRARALEHGLGAYGARYLRPGFAFTEKEDLLYAVGWPHVRVLTADHDPGARLSLPRVTAAWPANFASAFTRGLAKSWIAAEVDAAQLAPLGFGQPLTDTEARQILFERFVTSSQAQHTGQLLLAVEALNGPELVVEAVVAALDRFPADRALTYPVDLDAGIFVLGFILLRLPEAVARDATASLRARLEAGSLPRSLANHLDLILHGREGALRSAVKIDGAISRPHLQHVNDDPAFVAEEHGRAGPPRKHEPPLPRLAFLGGEAFLEREQAFWPKYAAQGGPLGVISAYGSIRSPRVVAIMAEIAHRSKAKTEALAWIESHRAYAEPILRERASSSAPAAAVLAKLR